MFSLAFQRAMSAWPWNSRPQSISTASSAKAATNASLSPAFVASKKA